MTLFFFFLVEKDYFNWYHLSSPCVGLKQFFHEVLEPSANFNTQKLGLIATISTIVVILPQVLQVLATLTALHLCPFCM